jgi:hypothetical protein
MKKLLSLCSIVLLAFMVQAQEFRLNVYGNYVFDDQVDSYYSTTSYFEGKIKGGFLWGGGLEYKPSKYSGIELSYMRLDTEAPMNYFNYNTNRPDNATFDLAINYIMLGGNGYKPVSDKVELFSGFQAGMAIFNVENPKNGNSDNATKFAWGIKIGSNIMASDKVGIKLQAGLLSSVQSVGGGLYFGTGGAGAGVSTYSSMLQFYLGGGLVFRFPKK